MILRVRLHLVLQELCCEISEVDFQFVFFKIWGKKWVYATKKNGYSEYKPFTIKSTLFSVYHQPLPPKKNSGMGMDGHRRNSWKIAPTWISLKGKFPSLLVERVMSGSVTSWWPMSTSNTFCSSSFLRNISKFTHSIHGTGIFTYIYHTNQPNKKKVWGKLYQSYGSYMILWLGSTPHPVWRLSLGFLVA